MDVISLVDEGIGNSSYLVDLGDGTALAVDPGRDPRPYLERARQRGLRVVFAVDTHVHADFVSGGRELAACGARFLAPVRAGLGFPHEGLRDGQEVDLGGLTLRTLGTAGHSPEHVSYLLLDGSRPLAVFTGGALIVGGVARTDLAGGRNTERWARAAYQSAQRLFALPGELPVYPTHGPGSFCSAGEPGERTSTIGRERARNPLLAGVDEEAFVARLLSGLGRYPTYFNRLPALNREGAPRYGTHRPRLPALTVAHVRRLHDEGALVVDVRPLEAFAAGHIPGSISNALRPAFATWLGWLADPARPLIAVLDEDQDRGELVEACLKIGYDNLAGELEGGIAAWRGAGLELATIPLVGADELGGAVLDVREDAEWRAGHIPGATHRPLGALDAASSAEADSSTVMCGHGERAMTAASLLTAEGASGLTVLRGGVGDWAAASGERLEREA